MRQNLAAVDPAPAETRVGKFVGLVPRQLGRDERLQAGQTHDLRQRSGKAKRIRQVQIRLAPMLAEPGLPVACAVQDLPYE